MPIRGKQCLVHDTAQYVTRSRYKIPDCKNSSKGFKLQGHIFIKRKLIRNSTLSMQFHIDTYLCKSSHSCNVTYIL